MIFPRAVLIVLMSVAVAIAAPKPASKQVTKFNGKPRVGQVGKPGSWFVQQRISNTEAIVKVDVYRATVVYQGRVGVVTDKLVATHLIYCKGFDFQNSTDGDRFPYRGVVKVTGTHTYKTVTGATNTVPLVEPTTLVAAFVEKRTWTDSTGKHRIEAVLVSIGDATVVLEKENKTKVTIPLEKLSNRDQQYVEKQRKERAAEVAIREIRRWHVKGGLTITAAYVKTARGRVYLREKNGKMRSVLVSRLSEADQQYVQQQREKQNSNDR